jgi:hypothetical protein
LQLAGKTLEGPQEGPSHRNIENNPMHSRKIKRSQGVTKSRKTSLGGAGLTRRAKQDYKGIIANFGIVELAGIAAPTFPSARAGIAPSPPAL